MAVDNRDSNEGRSNIYEEEKLKRRRGLEEGKQLFIRGCVPQISLHVLHVVLITRCIYNGRLPVDV